MSQPDGPQVGGMPDPMARVAPGHAEYVSIANPNAHNVMFMIRTPTGAHVDILTPEYADQVADNLHQMATLARSGLVLPPGVNGFPGPRPSGPIGPPQEQAPPGL